MLRCAFKKQLPQCILNKPSTSTALCSFTQVSTRSDSKRRTSSQTSVRNQSAMAASPYEYLSYLIEDFIDHKYAQQQKPTCEAISLSNDEVEDWFERITKETYYDPDGIKMSRAQNFLYSLNKEGLIHFHQDPNDTGKLYLRQPFDDHFGRLHAVDPYVLYDEEILKIQEIRKSDEKELTQEVTPDNLDDTTIERLVRKKTHHKTKDRIQVLNHITTQMELLKSSTEMTPQQILDEVLVLAKAVATTHEISYAKTRYTSNVETAKDREFIIASRALFSRAFELYQADAMCFPEVIQFGKKLIEMGLLLDREALIYVATSKFLEYYKIYEAMEKWSDLSLIDNCLDGGDLLFNFLLDPNSKVSDFQRKKLIKQLITTYEKVAPTTVGYAQFIVSLIKANEVDDAGILMSRLSIPGEDFIKPISEMLYEPYFCDVNLVHISQFADLFIKCVRNDIKKPKRFVKIKTNTVEDKELNPETGIEEIVQNEEPIYVPEQEAPKQRLYQGDGNVGFLLKGMRMGSAMREKRLKDQGKMDQLKLKKFKVDARGMHMLAQEVSNVWITLIETQLSREDDHNHELLAEVSFNEFLQWRDDLKGPKKKSKSDSKQDPSDGPLDHEKDQERIFVNLKIEKLDNINLKRRIVELARRFGAL